ncbi:YHS domain-containing protein, partial [Acinetobacter baumannii]|nr:YHS domain-containing protein [Acinetobacter baumannii]
AAAATRGGRATDPVCGMPVAADTPFRAEYDGQAVLFCSERCRARFVASPKTYLVGRPAQGVREGHGAHAEAASQPAPAGAGAM